MLLSDFSIRQPVTTVAMIIVLMCLGLLALAFPAAQDRLRGMPGYDQYTKMSKELQGGAFVSGAVTVRWELR